MSKKPPLGPRQFHFELLSPDEFELLVYLVVLLEHPNAIRLRAPDGGADAALPRNDGSYARSWQSKRFTSHVSWPQCKTSLDAAVGTYGMPHYTFCFARDLTGSQQELFVKHLVGRHTGVQVDWWGAGKLTSHLLGSEQGKRIETHFYGDPAADTEAFMRALRAGGELTTGSDAVARMSAIADFFESKDPFFSYALTSRAPSVAPQMPMTPGAVMALEIMTAEDRVFRIEALPRNRAAYERLPQAQLHFRDTPEGQTDYRRFRETLLKGGEETFSDTGVRFENLPVGLEAFGLVDEHMQLRIRADKRPPAPWDATLRVQTDRGAAALDIDLRSVEPLADWDVALSGTADGLTMTFSVRLRDGLDQARVNWTYSPSAGRVSAQANVLALLDALHGTGTMTIEERGGGARRYFQAFEGREPNELIGIAQKLLADIHTIEEWTGEPYELPDAWATEDYDEIAETAELIRTGERSGVPKFTLRIPPERLDELGEGPHAIWSSQGYGLRLFGVERSVGFLSGGFTGRISRSESVTEDGEELIEVDIEPVDPSETVVFKLTRDQQQEE